MTDRDWVEYEDGFGSYTGEFGSDFAPYTVLPVKEIGNFELTSL